MLKVILPRRCDYICQKFKSFTLECRFSPPALSVVWNVPGFNNIDLRNYQGHEVNGQPAEGSVTVSINSSMKYATYACNVLFPGGHPMVSDSVNEGTTLSHQLCIK